MYAKEHAEFITVTCLKWKHILNEDRFKDIIISSLSFLCKAKRLRVYCFVIMSNHFHLIWQMIGDHKREEVQRDFLKYTGQQILKHLRNEKSKLHLKLLAVITLLFMAPRELERVILFRPLPLMQFSMVKAF